MPNKILEAIQKGIQMGLEIQDDELDQTTFQKHQITSEHHVDRADQIRWIRDNFVDLGLPSGNLWCKYNLGATCGDTPESWYGNYYAWGETTTKDVFSWDAYKFYKADKLTKYANSNIQILEPEDDVVSVTLGKAFRMPTQKDIEELCSLPSKWAINYKKTNGLYGRIFTGSNGNELFIPAAGCRRGSYFDDAGSYCYLWSSSLNFAYPSLACYLSFDSDLIDPFFDGNRCDGFSVRGIL